MDVSNLVVPLRIFHEKCMDLGMYTVICNLKFRHFIVFLFVSAKSSIYENYVKCEPNNPSTRLGFGTKIGRWLQADE
jgi:hypothetical protein